MIVQFGVVNPTTPDACFRPPDQKNPEASRGLLFNVTSNRNPNLGTDTPIIGYRKSGDLIVEGRRDPDG